MAGWFGVDRLACDLFMVGSFLLQRFGWCMVVVAALCLACSPLGLLCCSRRQHVPSHRADSVFGVGLLVRGPVCAWSVFLSLWCGHLVCVWSVTSWDSVAVWLVYGCVSRLAVIVFAVWPTTVQPVVVNVAVSAGPGCCCGCPALRGGLCAVTGVPYASTPPCQEVADLLAPTLLPSPHAQLYIPLPLISVGTVAPVPPCVHSVSTVPSVAMPLRSAFSHTPKGGFRAPGMRAGSCPKAGPSRPSLRIFGALPPNTASFHPGPCACVLCSSGLVLPVPSGLRA